MNFNHFNFWDVALVKLAVAAAVLLLISIWEGFAIWAMSVHWGWYLGVLVLSSIKPMMSVFKK